jgi:hypothetical protein
MQQMTASHDGNEALEARNGVDSGMAGCGRLRCESGLHQAEGMGWQCAPSAAALETALAQRCIMIGSSVIQEGLLSLAIACHSPPSVHISLRSQCPRG